VESSKQPSFGFYLLVAAVLFLIGWGGLAAVIMLTLPTLGPRWLFFFLGVIATSGTILPFVYFFNRRFPSNPPAEPAVIMRQAVWFGVYASMLAWLQMGKMLTTTVAGILAVILVIVEILLRMRERAHWQPKG